MVNNTTNILNYFEKPLKETVDLAATNKKTVVAKIKDIVIIVKPDTSLSAAYEQYEQIRHCNWMFESLSKPRPRSMSVNPYKKPMNNMHYYISESVTKEAVKTAIDMSKKENGDVMVALDYYNISVNGSTNLENAIKQYLKQLDIIGRMQPELRLRVSR